MCKSHAYNGKDLSGFKNQGGRRIMGNKPKSTRKYTFVGHVKDLEGFTPSVIEYHYPTVKERVSKLGIPHQ